MPLEIPIHCSSQIAPELQEQMPAVSSGTPGWAANISHLFLATLNKAIQLTVNTSSQSNHVNLNLSHMLINSKLNFSATHRYRG